MFKKPKHLITLIYDNSKWYHHVYAPKRGILLWLLFCYLSLLFNKS